jgi:hypothetical protein
MGVEFVTRFPYRPNCEDHDLADSSLRGVCRASAA